MRTVLGALALLALSACAPAPDNGDTPLAAQSTSPAVVYQREGTIWVRPGHGPAVDVGERADGEPQHPDWSPDGTRLAFETDYSVVWTVAADGSDLRRVYECTGSCVAVQDEAWSPSGRAIAFMEARTKDGEHTSRALLRVLDLASGRTRTVHADRSGRVWIFGPRWSDDGTALVYEENVFASTRLDESVVNRVRVVTIDANGRSRRVVGSWKPSMGPGSPAPDWAGDSLVFVRHDNLVLVDVATGERSRITTYDGLNRHAIQPTFSPDGTRVVFTYVRGRFDVDDRAEGAVVVVATGAVSMLDLPGATHVRFGPSGDS